MRTSHISMVFMTMFMVSVVPAQEPSLSKVTKGIQDRYKEVQNIVAPFIQEIHFGFSNIKQEFSGTLTFRKPNNIRIESEHQTLVTDGITVWSYSPVNKQVVIDTYKENRNTITPDRFLTSLPENYYATVLGTEKQGPATLVVLKLVPKDDASFIRSVKMWIEIEKWIVRKIEIMDVNETATTYTIKDITLNARIEGQTFSFSPPPGTEVVDLR